MKLRSTLIFAVVLVPALAFGQTVTNLIINSTPPYAPLEKTVGYFCSTQIPCVVLGSSSSDEGPGGYYLYQCPASFWNGVGGICTKTTIDPIGDAYERTIAYTWPGDIYPGFMASRSGQLVWYRNPLNSGGDITQPWPMQVVNPNAGCHDMHVVDLEETGFPAVICSSVDELGTVDFIAFNNGTPDNWTVRSNPFQQGGLPIGDGIAPLSVSGGPMINVVGATTNGIFWFRNPILVGGSPRTDTWTAFLVGGANTGQSVGAVALMNAPYGAATDGVVAASGEEPDGPWTQGLVWYSAGSDPTKSWTAHTIGGGYRAVHEIDSGVFNDTPYIIVGEQEQAGGTPYIAGEHPGTPSRVMLFNFTNGGFSRQHEIELSTEGTHNQSAVMYGNDLLVVGANHDIYGTLYPALQAWLISNPGSPPSGGLADGTYRILNGSKSVDGGFGYFGDTPPVETYPTNTSEFQHWIWNGSTLQDAASEYPGHYLADNDDSTVSEPAGNPDTWILVQTSTPAGIVWTIRNVRTGSYLSKVQGALTMSKTQTLWTIQ